MCEPTKLSTASASADRAERATFSVALRSTDVREPWRWRTHLFSCPGPARELDRWWIDVFNDWILIRANIARRNSREIVVGEFRKRVFRWSPLFNHERLDIDRQFGVLENRRGGALGTILLG